MKKNRGQVAIEYLILTGIVLLVLIFILYYVIDESNQTVKMNKARDVVSILAKSVDMVYILGPGSQDFVQIDMPGGVENIIISGKEIALKIRIFGNISDIFEKTKANVIGTLSATSGTRHVSVKALENNTVRISE